MKKNQLFSVVLFLFLLVPASITWAQITKTINGTVRYKSGMSETKFITPYGEVNMDLPQSLSGTVISGTVTTVPAGKNQKEKNRNLKDLLKMTLMLGDQKIQMAETPLPFDWKANTNPGQRTPVKLIHFLGNEIGGMTLPPVLITPHIVNPSGEPNLSTASNVIIKGDLLNVYTDKLFTPGEKFIVTDSRGQRFILKPRCLSVQQAVLDLPKNIAPGEITVSEEIWNQPGYAYKTNIVQSRLLDFQLSSPNTSLQPGGKSVVELHVIVTDSKGEWVNPDIEKLINGTMTIDMRNLNPNTVTVDGGNFQRLYLDRSNVNPSTGNFDIIRGITGKAVGSFSVSATLHENYSTSNDPFRPQLNVLNTPEDFNAWTGAMKKDLNQFAILDDDGGPNTQVHSAIKANIQRAIDNMPVCPGPEQLDECKAVAYSLIQPLQVPKGAAISWLSSYESFKSMINSPETMSGLNDLPDWDIIQNGLNFIQRFGYKTNDPAINREAENSGQLLDKCRENVPSSTQLEQLRNSLRSLVKTTDSKINADAGEKTIWNLRNLLFDTYCLNKRTRDGIDPQKSMIGYLDPVNKILKVKPENQQQVLNSLHAIPTGSGTYRINAISETRKPVSYEVQLMPLMFVNKFDGDDWAKHLIEEVLRKDTSRGSIIDTTRKPDGTWYVYYENAKCVLNSYSAKERTSDCTKELSWDEKENKIKETGRYERTMFYPTGSCLKGNDYCTEVYVVSSTTQIFLDANCARRIRSWDFKHFSCL